MTRTRTAVERLLPDETDRADSNARMCALLSTADPGPLGDRLVLLHFTGRRSGRRYTVPAGLHELDGRLVVATGSPWRHNFAGGAPGEMTWRGQRRGAYLTLVDGVDPVAAGYLALVQRYGKDAARRRLGIAINVDRIPTLHELRDAVRRCRLALVEVDIRPRTSTSWGGEQA